MKLFTAGKIRAAFVPAVMAIALSSIAYAHPGHLGTENGFAQGALHPWTGLDHMLAMLVVGAWAAMRRGRMLWGLPAAFMGGMLLGSVLGISGLALPGVEHAIAASVVLLGLAVALAAARVPSAGALALVALSGLFHGHAHGAEMALHLGAAAYIAGMLISTALLHAGGLGLMTLALNRDWSLKLARYASGAAALCGALMLAGVL